MLEQNKRTGTLVNECEKINAKIDKLNKNISTLNENIINQLEKLNKNILELLAMKKRK